MSAIWSDKKCQQFFWWALAFAAVMLFTQLGAADIYILDEAKNAQCAREMWHNGEWIVPTFNAELRTDKPVLHYWFMIASYKLFGFGYWQARFFSAVFGLGTLLVVFFAGKRLWNPRIALGAVLALVLSPHFLFEFRLSVPDPYLIFFSTCGFFAGLLYIEDLSWKWALLTGLSLGLATLAKGPVALALPGLCFMVYIIVQKKWKALASIKWVAAAIVYFAVAIPWYWLVHQQTAGAFTEGFFLDHNLNRFSDEKEGHGGNFFVVPVMVLAGMLPLSVLIFSRLRKKAAEWKEPLFVLSAVVSLVFVVFYGISSTKLPNYPMPAYPLLAILASAGFIYLLEQAKYPPMYALVTWLVIGLSLPIGGFFALKAEMDVATEAPLAWGLAILAAAQLLAFFVRKSGKPATSWKLALGGWVFMNAFALWIAYPKVYSHNPATQAYKTVLSTNSSLVAYKAFNPALLVQNPSHNFQIPVYQDPDALKQAIDSANNREVSVVTREEFVPEIESLGFKLVLAHKDLFELPTTVLLQPAVPKEN